MKKKLHLILLMTLTNFIVFSQVADYFTAGYHVEKYDTFLEDFTKRTEPCIESNTFRLSITATKMRIEIEDSSINSGNTLRDSYTKDILIVGDLPVDSGALFHKSFQGVMKKLILDDAYTKTGIPKYQTLKFSGRMYSHKINFDVLIGDRADVGDIYFLFIYENGEKDNMQLHLSQKSPSQIQIDNLKNKMNGDMVEIQNQKQLQLQQQQQIFEEQERLRKAQKAEKNIQDVNNLMNQLQNVFKK